MGYEGRLIDAKFAQHIADVELSRDEAGIVQWVLSHTPTVDAAEVVHGQWVAVPSSDMMTGKAYKCSECKKMRYGSFMPNYCSNCGAKMDLKG